MQEPELTVSQVAEFHEVSIPLVHQWIGKGLLVPSRDLGMGKGRGYRFQRADVIAFVAPRVRRARLEYQPTPDERALVEESRARFGLGSEASLQLVAGVALAYVALQRWPHHEAPRRFLAEHAPHVLAEIDGGAR